MSQHHGAQHARIDDGLAGAVGAGGVHDVGGIAHQRDAAIHPGRDGLAVDHRVLKHLAGAAQHGGHVHPAEVPAVEVVGKLFHRHAPVPVALAPAAGVVHGDLGDPVDGGQARGRVGLQIG